MTSSLSPLSRHEEGRDGVFASSRLFSVCCLGRCIIGMAEEVGLSVHWLCGGAFFDVCGIDMEYGGFHAWHDQVGVSLAGLSEFDQVMGPAAMLPFVQYAQTPTSAHANESTIFKALTH